MSEVPSGLSLFHPQGRIARPSNPFGKDIANAALFRALMTHGGYKDIAVLNQVGLSDEELMQEFGDDNRVRIFSAKLTNVDFPAIHGTLIRGQPYLSDLAWVRRRSNYDQKYSLVGLIHTIAPPAVRELIAASALAPTHPWDALVCTSPSVQLAMSSMFDGFAEHCASRLGAIRTPRPSLPVIPLAVDTAALALQGADQEARHRLRQHLCISDDDVVALWVGRLSFYEKAFPQSMFQAMALAAQESSHRMHFLLVGWFPGGDPEKEAYKEAAQLLSPNLNVIVLDGNNPSLVAQSWAASDFFVSLVDNIQETFGLTPVEAMSAGLPVVVSNWDGYRYTVRDQVDGFLVPTLISPGGQVGELLASLHSFELETYQTYVGAVAQYTAVNIQFAAAAIVRLVNDVDLRRSMGESAQKRALTTFSWPTVVSQYKELFAELAEVRRGSDFSSATAGSRIQPIRGEPFADFSHFATHTLHPEQFLRLAEGVQSSDLQIRLKVKLNRQFAGIRSSDDLAHHLLQKLEIAGPNGLTVQELLLDAKSEQHPFLETTLVWLSKMGLIDWL